MQQINLYFKSINIEYYNQNICELIIIILQENIDNIINAAKKNLTEKEKKTLFLPPNPRSLSPCFINILIQKMDFLERTLIPHMG